MQEWLAIKLNANVLPCIQLDMKVYCRVQTRASIAPALPPPSCPSLPPVTLCPEHVVHKDRGRERKHCVNVDLVCKVYAGR